MNCRDIEAKASDHHDGCLAPEQVEAFADHLRECPACRDFHNSFETTLQVVQEALTRRAPREVVEAVETGVQRRISKGA